MNTYYYMLTCGGYSRCNNLKADSFEDFKFKFNELHKDHTLKCIEVYHVVETKLVKFNE